MPDRIMKTGKDPRLPSVQDTLQAEAECEATDAVIAVLRRARAERPDLLPKGLPRILTEKLAMAACDAWIRIRAEQANRLGFCESWTEAFIQGKAPAEHRWLYEYLKE